VPGGALETGETVEEAAVRETREETMVSVRPIDVITVADYIEKERNRIRWHYVLIDVLCAYVDGEPHASSDADNARFVELREVSELDVTPAALELIEKALKVRGGRDI
jgi:8-oxo-dGTP diphosphatase